MKESLVGSTKEPGFFCTEKEEVLLAKKVALYTT